MKNSFLILLLGLIAFGNIGCTMFISGRVTTYDSYPVRRVIAPQQGYVVYGPYGVIAYGYQTYPVRTIRVRRFYDPNQPFYPGR
jgi:hypothetical protein